MKMLIFVAGALALSACGPAEDNEDPTIAESTSALVTKSQVVGDYTAVSKRLAIVKCNGGCSVTYQEVSASGALSVASGTFTCAGSDCGDTAGTWSFPAFGDWRYLAWSGNNGWSHGAKVGEAATNIAALTVRGPRRPNISGTYVDYVNFVHN